MKNTFYLMLAVLVLAVLGSTVTADTPDTRIVSTPPAQGIAYSYPSQTGLTVDTITNAGADTITLSTNLLSDLKYNWTITGDQLSGTIDLTIVIQESNQLTSSPDDWIQVGTATIDADDESVRITGEHVYGVKQRIIITGSGTQSAEYSLNARFKH